MGVVVVVAVVTMADISSRCCVLMMICVDRVLSDAAKGMFTQPILHTGKLRRQICKHAVNCFLYMNKKYVPWNEVTLVS